MPTLLEPPPARAPHRSSSLPSTRRPDPRWTDKFIRSGFFLGAVLVHLVAFMLLAALVVIRAPSPSSDDVTRGFIVPTKPSSTPAPPVLPAMPKLDSASLRAPSVIPAAPAQASSFVPAPIRLETERAFAVAAAGHSGGKPNMPSPPSFDLRAFGVRKFLEEGQHRTPGNIRGDFNNDPHNYQGTFPVYVASYADGDWGCNVVMQDGKIVAGSLPDLVTKINEWSHHNIRGSVMPEPLDIGAADLMAKKPPFIFFTGHKDFVLTDAEINNLRMYLQMGGAIWGDNALPGSGSRFDVAFRREMKRVVPDVDKPFQDVPLDHEIFTKSWFDLKKLPQGMNYYSEPLQHLDIDGKIAIIYTPNDYSDLFFLNILPGDTAMGQTIVLPGGTPLFTNGNFLWNSALFFRNFNLATSLASQRLGMNIVSFLLVRFDRDLALLPSDDDEFRTRR